MKDITSSLTAITRRHSLDRSGPAAIGELLQRAQDIRPRTARADELVGDLQLCVRLELERLKATEDCALHALSMWKKYM